MHSVKEDSLFSSAVRFQKCFLKEMFLLLFSVVQADLTGVRGAVRCQEERAVWPRRWKGDKGRRDRRRRRWELCFAHGHLWLVFRWQQSDAQRAKRYGNIGETVTQLRWCVKSVKSDIKPEPVLASRNVDYFPYWLMFLLCNLFSPSSRPNCKMQITFPVIKDQKKLERREPLMSADCRSISVIKQSVIIL